MKKYVSGSCVNAGTYLDTAGWTIWQVRHDGDVLPGKPGAANVRLNPAALAVVGPLLGFAFVIALPFIIFGYAGKVLLTPLAAAAARTGRSLADALGGTAVPGLAYFLRRKVGKPDERAAKSDLLKDLSAETESRKEEEKRQ